MLNSHKPRVTLTLCPIWAVDAPPLGPAYLAGTLKQHGYDTRCLDLNTRLHRTLRKHDPDKLAYWSGDSWKLWERSYVFRTLFSDRYDDFSPDVAATRDFCHAVARDFATAILDTSPDVVGFTVMGNTALLSLVTAQELRRRDPRVRIIFGGPSILKNDDTTRFFLRTGVCDAAVIGEGEAALLDLLADYSTKGTFRPVPGTLVPLADGDIHYGGDRPNIAPIDGIAWPDFSDMPPADYILQLSDFIPGESEFAKSAPTVTMLMSRGCLANCTFCADKPFWGGWTQRSGDDVFAEMLAHHQRYGATHFNFNDLMINGALREMERMCDRIIEEDAPFKWGGSARAKPTIPPPLMEKMVRAGCIWLSFGFEHFSDNVLRKLKKGTTARANQEALDTATSLGISVSSGLIIGTPGETQQDLEILVEFCARNQSKLVEVHPGPLSLMPGAPLYEQRHELGITITPHPDHAPHGLDWANAYVNPFISHWVAEDGANTPERRDERVEWVRRNIANAAISMSEHGVALAHVYSSDLARVTQLLERKLFDEAINACDERLQSDPNDSRFSRLRLSARLAAAWPALDPATAAQNAEALNPAVLPDPQLFDELVAQFDDDFAKRKPVVDYARYVFPLFSIGKYAIAARLAHGLRTTLPNDTFFPWVEAAALEKLGAFDEALAVLEPLLDRPMTSHRRATIQDTRAAAILRSGRPRDALAPLTETLMLEPARIESRIALAYALFACNHPREALDVLDTLAPVTAVVPLPPVTAFSEAIKRGALQPEAAQHAALQHEYAPIDEPPADVQVGAERVGFRFILPEHRALFTPGPAHEPPALAPQSAAPPPEIPAPLELFDGDRAERLCNVLAPALAEMFHDSARRGVNLGIFYPLMWPLFAAGAYDTAREIALAMTALTPADPYPRWIIGAALEKQQRFDEALAALDDALALPASLHLRATIQDSRGAVLLRLTRFDDALRALAETLVLEPQRVETRVALAYTLAKLERGDAAKAVLATLSPRHVFARGIRFDFVLPDDRGWFDAALAPALDATLDTTPDAGPRDLFAYAGAALRDRLADVIDAIVRDHQQLGFDLGRYYTLMWPLFAAEAWQPAATLARAMHSVTPNDPYPLWIEAAANEKMGHLEASLDLIDKALKLGADAAPPAMFATLLDTRAAALSRTGRYTDAMKAADHALKLDPTRDETRLIAAYAAWKSGRRACIFARLQPLMERNFAPAIAFAQRLTLDAQHAPPDAQNKTLAPQRLEASVIRFDFVAPEDAWRFAD